LYFMDTAHACAAQKRIVSLLETACSDGMPDDIMQFVVSLMDAYIHVPKSLQELAQLALWKGVHCHVPALRSIYMPKAFFTAISSLFDLDID